MHEPFLTVVGNVGAPPRSRVLPSGVVVTDFRLASTPRRLDRATGTWSDGETLWFAVSCWRLLAEHVVDCVRTGDRVVVTGLLRLHTWRTEQGEERTRLEVDAQTVGFDLSRSRVVQDRGAAATPSPDAGPPGEPEADGVLGEGVPDDLSEVVPAQVGAGTGPG